jgi:hypothetical protein
LIMWLSWLIVKFMFFIITLFQCLIFMRSFVHIVISMTYHIISHEIRLSIL